MYGIVVLFSKLNSSIKSLRLTILHCNIATQAQLFRFSGLKRVWCKIAWVQQRAGHSDSRLQRQIFTSIQNVIEPKTCYFGKALLNLDRRQNLSILTTRKPNSPRKDSDTVTQNRKSREGLRTAFFQRYSDELHGLWKFWSSLSTGCVHTQRGFHSYMR